MGSSQHLTLLSSTSLLLLLILEGFLPPQRLPLLTGYLRWAIHPCRDCSACFVSLLVFLSGKAPVPCDWVTSVPTVFQSQGSYHGLGQVQVYCAHWRGLGSVWCILMGAVMAPPPVPHSPKSCPTQWPHGSTWGLTVTTKSLEHSPIYTFFFLSQDYFFLKF